MNKPCIHRKWYPKLRRHFWNVSPMPPASKRKLDDYDRWKKAYAFTLRLNYGIALALEVQHDSTI